MPELANRASRAAEILHHLLEKADIDDSPDENGFVTLSLRLDSQLYYQLACFDPNGDADREFDPTDDEDDDASEDEDGIEDDDPAEECDRYSPKLGADNRYIERFPGDPDAARANAEIALIERGPALRVVK